jgi:serine/threonine-protein kinase
MTTDEERRSLLLDLTGELIHDKYRVTKRLASGGMGDVYSARHELLGKELAIKFMKPELASDEETMTRFFKEAQIAASAKSDHVVDVTDLGFHKKIPFIVMEFLEGMTLEDAIYSDAPPGSKSAIRILIQVGKTLEKIHGMGVIHRDLKPSNLMLVDRDGREVVKILDFGISLLKSGKEYLRLTSTGAIMGTPFYMAPEQARGEKDMDHRVDIYALGAIMYELIARRPPFTGENYNQVIIQVATEEPDELSRFKPGVASELVRIVKKAMAKKPDDRYQCAADMVADLQAFYEGRTGESPTAERGLVDQETLPVEPVKDEPEPETEARATRPQTGGTIQPVAYRETDPGTRRRSGARYALPIVIAVILAAGAIAAGIVIKKVGSATPAEPVKASAGQVVERKAEPEEPAVPSVMTHSLSVYTEPAEAWIEINGSMQGQSPITVKAPEGRIRVRIARTGYDIVNDEFELTDSTIKRYTLVEEGSEPAPAEEPAKPETKKPPKDEPEGKKKPPKAEPGKPKYGDEVD